MQSSNLRKANRFKPNWCSRKKRSAALSTRPETLALSVERDPRLDIPSRAAGGADEGLEVRDGRGAIDPVAEVDDVPLTAAGRDAATRRLRDLIRRAGPQQSLIDIALEDE